MSLDDRKKELLLEFVKFVKQDLGIRQTPTIAVLNRREGLKTTANYDYSQPNKIIKVFGGNRMLVDIMRSIAHEMVHHKQWEDGKLETPPPDIGGPIEDGANAIAGQLIKKFAKLQNSIYDE